MISQDTLEQIDHNDIERYLNTNKWGYRCRSKDVGIYYNENADDYYEIHLPFTV